MSAPFLKLAELEQAARRRLPRFVWDFVAGGAEDEATLAANGAAFARYPLVPNVLRDVSVRDSGIALFGQRFREPFGIAPMGGVALCRAGGDVFLAQAAAAAGVPMILSGAAFTALEEVAAAAPGLWFQPLLPPRLDDGIPLLERARAAGVEALVVTADLAVPGRRDADIRNGFGHPLRLHPRLVAQALMRPRWLLGTGLRFRNGTPIAPNLAPASGRRPPPMAGLSFAAIAALRRRWPGPLVIKGVLAADDARRCVAEGADGVIVSNHGGRQLDGAIATLDALAGIKAAVGDAPMMLDGGIRRGTDVVKALALGAAAVFVGRPFLYAVAIDGRAGAGAAIDLLAAEVDRALALCGCATPADVSPALVAYDRGAGR